MAALSIVVPVYGVEQFLRECLDSILAQTGEGWTGDEIEVVAVDDCSPDGSPAILAEYAARDPRLVVVTNRHNLGLGGARNVGLDNATGDYVWFVDSDDWLTPGSLAAVVDRLSATRPDVLVVGFDRRYPGGLVVPERLLPPGPPLLDVVDARSEPRLLGTLHIACNKVVRREFLLDTGCRFADGWYEDVSFSHPLLLAAERVAVLDRACYAYRQRGEGAITNTRTERHNEVFEQWHRVMTYVEMDQPDLRGPMFERMIWHYLGVLNHPSRIHRGQRRAFFGRIVADYRTYLPRNGYPRPDGVARIRFALVAMNLFWVFELLRTVYRSRLTVGSTVRAVRRSGRRLYYVGQRLRPLRDAVAVYAGASHHGYAGSPHARTVAAVLEEGRVLTHAARTVLITDQSVGSLALTTQSYRSTTLRALRAFARSRTLVTDGELPAGIEPRPSQDLIRLAPPRVVVPSARTAEPDNPAHVP